MMKFEDLVKKWFKINPFLMIFDDDFSKICDEEKPFVQPCILLLVLDLLCFSSMSRHLCKIIGKNEH